MDQIIKQFYSKLVTTLPMDDACFRSMLYSEDLLPGNLKDRVQSKPTCADKAEYFLDQNIKNNEANFIKLLEVLEQSKDNNMIKLARQIRHEIDDIGQSKGCNATSRNVYFVIATYHFLKCF